MLRMRRAAVGLFVVLWITAMSTYPGWTQFDANSVGHDWWRNFLCDLLAAETPDGRINLLGSIAMTVSVVVVIFGGMLRLWWNVEALGHRRSIARTGAVLAIMLTLCICIEQVMALDLPHGVLALAAGGVGLVPTAMVMLDDWRRADCTWLRRFAIVGLGVSAVTNFVTYSIVQLGGELTPVVPTAQKFSIVFLLLWLWLVDHRTPSRLA
ncbi:MAG: hypothetical protein ACI9SE_000747 [Neolewinella sp.]|jgi:hypothetical protein